MLWGHEIVTREGRERVTRDRFNRAFGVAVPEKPEVPEYLKYVWLAWWRLNARRPSSDSVHPIQFAEIEAFSRLSNEQFSSDDLRMIEAIDDAFIQEIGKEQKAMAERKNEERPPKKSAKR